MVGVGLALMVVSGLPFGPAAFALLILGTGLGFAYDLWLKWTAWSWLPYFLALPLLPIWVFTALGRPEPLLIFLYPLGALATVGVHFAQALPDAMIDQSVGSRSPTSRLGQGKSFLVAWLAVLSAPALAWIAATWTGIVALTPIEIAAAASVSLFATNLGMFLTDRRLGTTTSFPFVALSALISGSAWAIAVAR
jgi:4-hydroxybenzoate polyprenyltransferase